MGVLRNLSEQSATLLSKGKHNLGDLVHAELERTANSWDALYEKIPYERGIYSPADHSYVLLALQKRRIHTHFVASRRPSRRLSVTSRGDVPWEGGGRTSILFECWLSERDDLGGHVLGGGSRGTCPGERVGG